MVERLTTDLGITRIGVMYQDDSFGRAGYSGVQEALDRRGMEVAAVGIYPRNTTAVKRGLLDLRRGDPEAVVLIGAYQPVASAIAWARHIGMNLVFIAISFTGGNELAQALGKDAEGVFVTQVVPLPTDSSHPAVSSYMSALSAYDSEAVPNFVSLEGYLAGRLAILGVEECAPRVTRECFMDAIRGAEAIDIDGFSLSFGDDSQGSDTVFLTMISKDGSYHSIKTLPPEALEDSGR